MSFKQSRKYCYREHVYLHGIPASGRANTTKFQVRIAPNGTDLLLTTWQAEQWDTPVTALFQTVAKKLADEHASETGQICNVIAPEELLDDSGRYSKTETEILYRTRG